MKHTAIGKAPGRIDFMGGVADYSGSLVLEMPIRATTRVRIARTAASTLRVISPGHEPCETDWLALAALLRRNVSDKRLRQRLESARVPHWARYVIGSLLVFSSDTGWQPEGGLEFDVRSNVPLSAGVSSSAALEVATLRALETLSGTRLKGARLAHLGQRAENHLVGAPCGLMDQLTCAYGKRGHLLPILCRPDCLGEWVKLPAGVTVVGWPSGVKHAVSASPYATARAAAFMGKRMAEAHTKRRWTHAAEVPPSLLRQPIEPLLPEQMTGREFLDRYRKVDDPLSSIVPGRTYPVRAAFRFPVEENFRGHLAVSLLRGVGGRHTERLLAQVGELMLQSHAGYSAMGLGCPETDQMVDALMAVGPQGGIYGGRVSGGGSGGTVVVLLATRALPTLKNLARKVCFNRSGPMPLIV